MGVVSGSTRRLPRARDRSQHPWMPGDFQVYLLRCADGTYYVGHTDDLEKRLAAHRAGRGWRHTAARLPIELVHTETTPSRARAMTRETQLKKWSRAKKEALISADTTTLRSLSRSREAMRCREQDGRHQGDTWRALPRFAHRARHRGVAGHDAQGFEALPKQHPRPSPAPLRAGPGRAK